MTTGLIAAKRLGRVKFDDQRCNLARLAERGLERSAKETGRGADVGFLTANEQIARRKK
jgi:hypothetical protein